MLVPVLLCGGAHRKELFSIAAALGLSAGISACSVAPDLGVSADAITQGAEDAGDPAVVFVSGCTGTLIAPRVVITAAHCVTALFNDGSVFFGAAIEGPGVRVPVIEARLHPGWDAVTLENDIALLLLDQASSVTPVPLRTSPIDDGAVGQPARVVGFGVSAPDAAGSAGVKRQGQTSMIGYLATTWLDSASPSSTCQGDSGGPAFLTVDGAEQLAGIASSGDANCAQFGVKTRVDAYVADFIQPYLDATAPGAAKVGATCAYPEQCAGGRCATALDDPDLRYCTASCGGDGDCPGAMRCMQSLCRYPPPSPGAIGAPCDRGADCRSGQCIADGFGGARLCTVSCEPDAAKPCTEGWTCAADEKAPDTYACLPIADPTDRPPAAGSCRMEGGQTPLSSSAGALSLLLFALAFRRRALPGRRAHLRGLVAVALAGCADASGSPANDRDPCVDQGAPRVELGTSPDDGEGYLPLSDGQRAPLVHGPQGGFHVWSNLRARHLCPTGLRVERVVTAVADAQDIVRLRATVSLISATDAQLAADGWGELGESLPTFLCPNAPGLFLAGSPLRIELRVDDSNGRTASDAREITPYCREDDPFLSACAGQCDSPPPADAGAD